MCSLWFLTFCVIPSILCIDPNFVIILTDDQDLLLNGMYPMKKTIELLARNGKTFNTAVVNSPICCPSRSSLLTGKYAHNTGVVNNSISGNCSSTYWQTNQELYSISAILKNTKNYRTFYAGKYLNKYGYSQSGGVKHVPKGYDWWIGLRGNSVYYNYTLSVNGTAKFYKNSYLTDVLNNYALDFLNQNYIKHKPFIMTVAPPASHAPFVPADRHKNMFPDMKAVRSPSFNFTPIEKHWIVRMPPVFLPSDVSMLDNIQRRRLQTLLAVDEMVENIVNKLKSEEVLNRTFIIFSSDNGFHIGQFTQPWDKRQPYETDVRVPFIISGPNIPSKTFSNFPISVVDIAPTILDIANINTPKFMDGLSFKKQLFSDELSSKTFRKYILVEYWGEGNQTTVDPNCPWKYDENVSECVLDGYCKCQDSRNNTYVCLIEFSHQKHIKFCQFDDDENFIEVYDLHLDPYELKNLSKNLETNIKNQYLLLLNELKRCTGSGCSVFNHIL